MLVRIGRKRLIIRQYYPRKLLGPLKSGMGRGLRPSVASLVERTPAALPLLSIGRASGSTSGSASRGGWAAEIFILLPRDFGSSYLLASNDTKSGAYVVLCSHHLPIFPSQLPPCRLWKPFPGWHLVRSIRQYYPRKLLGPLKSGMGRGLRPSAVSSQTRPSLLSVGSPTTGWMLEVTFGVISSPILIYVSRHWPNAVRSTLRSVRSPLRARDISL